MKKLYFTKEKIGWILYDFADSSYVTIIVTVLFSLYFKDIVVGQEELGTALWGRAISISMLFVALLAPFIGAVADYSHSRKLLLMLASYITIVFTAFLYFVQKGDIALAMLLFIVSNFAFGMCNVFYNSFLPDIAEKHEVGRISGISWGIGYLGGLAALLLVMPIMNLSLPDDLEYRYSFFLVAVFFFIFSLPTFFWLKEKRKPNIEKKNYFIVGFQRIKETAKHIRKFKELLKYLLSFFFMNDGIVVIMSFAAIYGGYLGLTTQEVLFSFILAQPSSFLGALIFGFITDKIGAKKSISISLLLWVIVIVGAYLSVTKTHYYILVICAGFLMGSSQASGRTMLALLTPVKKATEFFGFYNFTGRMAAILGPLVYGEISRVTGEQRYGILSIMLFFIAGFIVLQFVNEKKGENVAVEMNEFMEN